MKKIKHIRIQRLGNKRNKPLNLITHWTKTNSTFQLCNRVGATSSGKIIGFGVVEQHGGDDIFVFL